MCGWCPWGVLEVPSGLVGTIYTQSNLVLMENPYFEHLAVFYIFLHDVEMEWNLLDVAKALAIWQTQMGLGAQKAMQFGSPPQRDQKLRLPQKYFFRRFLGPQVVDGLCAGSY